MGKKLKVTERARRAAARIDVARQNAALREIVVAQQRALASCRSALGEAVRAMNVADQVASVVVNRWNERGGE
jgi:hypothetical protein